MVKMRVFSSCKFTSNTCCHLLVIAVSGLGFGVICGAFSLVNVLADMTGPGTIGIYGDPQTFFIASGMPHFALYVYMDIFGDLYNVLCNGMFDLEYNLITCMLLCLKKVRVLREIFSV